MPGNRTPGEGDIAYVLDMIPIKELELLGVVKFVTSQMNN